MGSGSSTEDFQAPVPTAEGHRPGPMGEVSAFFRDMDDAQVLEYCLGFDKPNVPVLAKHCLLVVLKCQSFDQKPYPLLEIGLHTFQRKQMQNHIATPGSHAENMLHSISYHHIRIQDNARYVNRLPCPDASENNCFGSTRFVDKVGAEDFVFDSLLKPMDPEFPELGPCPVVLLDYVSKDNRRLLQESIDLPRSAWRSVVASISTQQIAREQGFDWRDHRITLGELTKDLKIEFQDPQGAANYAAYTIISGIHVVMRPRLSKAMKSLQLVINETMLYSQSLIPDWGERDYCTKCGEWDHVRTRCKMPQLSVHCARCLAEERYAAASTHITPMCPW